MGVSEDGHCHGISQKQILFSENDDEPLDFWELDDVG